MGIFGGGGQKPEKIFGVKVNQSQLGYPWPVLMGTGKLRQNVLWFDNFVATKYTQGGKGGGGADGYTYTADVVTGLCNGSITAIGDIWTGNSWLGTPHSIETYSIPVGGGTYTTNNASTFVGDMGVSMSVAYSGTYSDFNAPTSNVLSGTYQVPMQLVTTAPTSGQYKVNVATGQYTFSGADYGKTVTMYYSYDITTINQQENDIIPAGKTIMVGGTQTFAEDLGVVYTTGVNQGVEFSRVYSTPTATGTYSVSGSAPATYTFASGDIGAEVTITFQITDPNAVQQNQSSLLDFTMSEGYIGQSPYSFLSASFPNAALGYSGIATLLFQPMFLGTSGDLQQITVEASTPDVFGGGGLDCNPIQCIGQVLTNQQWGLGVGAVPFPVSVIDNGTVGTWGAYTGGTQSNSTAWAWFAANNFFISPIIESQNSAASEMSKWLEAGMCSAFYSEGLLKLVPYGDTTTAANGCTWVAPSTAVVALDDTCFIGKENQDPIKIIRNAWQDAYNAVQVQWENRNNQYAQEVTQESDQALINRYGERRESPQNWDFIHTLTAATFAANLRLKHGTSIRNTYEFTLPYTYAYLEPMDVVTIGTTSPWAAGLNNANLAIANMAVRITKIIDDPVNGLQVTAEDYNYGAHLPVIYNKQLSTPDVVANAYADPGFVTSVVFVATPRMTGYASNEILIGATGASSNYGSCNVWVSQDGTTYEQIGTINKPARLGTLASTLASGSDPDTTHSMVVQLAQNSPALVAGSTTDADQCNTLCYVGGELISYSACSVTGQNTYTMGTYLRRGQLGSTISSHSTGASFLRLDNAVFSYAYDPSWAGKTVYFKMQAVNTFGNNPQPLSNITAVSFAIPSTIVGSVSPLDGTIKAGTVTYTGGATVDSLKPAQAGADVTASHTAAGIAGQGALATLNSVNLDTQVTDGTTYVRPKYVNSDGTFHGSNAFVNQGSTLPVQPIASPTFTTTTTSITINSSSQSMLLPNGNTVTVTGSGISYTGLSANTTYYIYPYVRLSDNTIQYANPNPPLTSSNSSYAMNARLDGSYALIFSAVTTPTTGTGSGGGTDYCPECNELVEVQGKGQIKAGDVQVGDLIKGWDFTNNVDVFRRVVSYHVSPAGAWRIVDGHKVSPAEQVYHQGAWKPAYKASGAEFNGDAGIRVNIAVDASDDGSHNFWLVGGTPLLSHNNLIGNPIC